MNKDKLNKNECLLHLFSRLNIPASSSVTSFKEDSLLLVNSDSLLVESSLDSITLNQNNICFVKKGEYLIENENKINVELIKISFHADFVKGFIQKHAELIALGFKEDLTMKSIVELELDQFIKNAIKTLDKFKNDNLSEVLLFLKLEELLLLILRSDKSAAICQILRKQTAKAAERLHFFMEKNFLADWNLNQFSKEFGASLTTFKELFYEVYGVSPRAWITERRLLYAYNLLLSSETRIVDIAIESGFSSQSYFTQSYRRRFGTTPSKVRNDLGLTTN